MTHKSEPISTAKDYKNIIADVKYFFPEVEELVSERTEYDVATLSYREYGRTLDVLYTGSGLKHFVDILVKATLSQASVVLIDEPEMGLHPSLQREMLSYFHELAQTKGVQFFLATHSPLFLLDANKVRAFRVQNRLGKRDAFPLSQEKLYMIWADLGIRPGDLLQNDLVLLVEGKNDVIFFEHIIHNLYRKVILFPNLTCSLGEIYINHPTAVVKIPKFHFYGASVV